MKNGSRPNTSYVPQDSLQKTGTPTVTTRRSFSIFNGKSHRWAGSDYSTLLSGNRAARRQAQLLTGKAWYGGLLLAILAAPLLPGCNGGNSSGGNTATFRALGTFQVPNPGQSAEIAAATPDGNTVIYTDAGAKQVGFVNITNLNAVTQIGAVDTGGSPTSVAVTRDGAFALVVVDNPNRLLVINIATRNIVSTRNLNGQPDSIVVSPDGRFAAIAIENQRPDETQPLPSAPPGLLTVVRLTGAPAAWTLANVSLTGLPNLRFANDPEPEFVDINSFNRAAVTLQENNAIAIVNLESLTVERTFSAGTTTHSADLQDNGAVSFTDTLTNARREPDGIAWTRFGNLLTANEGDYNLDLAAGEFVGGRNFTIFSPTGTVLFDDNGNLEKETANAGRYPDGRSDNKGAEPEGAEIATFGARQFAFIALERADALAVYRIDSESNPTFVQILPTGDAPEGVLAIPGRNMVITANEDDGTLSFFGL